MIIQRNFRTAVINTAEYAPLTFLDVDFKTPVLTGALATYMRIGSVTDWIDKRRVHGVVGNRGVEGQPQISRILPADLTLTGPVPAGTVLYFHFEMETVGYEFELMRYHKRPGAQKTVQIVIGPTDTVNTILARLYVALRNERYDYTTKGDLFVPPLTGTVTAGPTTISAITAAPYSGTLAGTSISITAGLSALDLYSPFNSMFFDLAKITGSDGNLSDYLTYVGPGLRVAPSLIQTQYEGRGNFSTMREIRLETESSLMPYWWSRQELPLQGALYSCIHFYEYKYHNEMGGTTVMNEEINANHGYEIYILEATAGPLFTYRGDVVDFLDYSGTAAPAVTQPNLDPLKYKTPVWYNAAIIPAVTTAALFKV